MEVLDPAPTDRVLEIGCGRGVAVGLLLGRTAGVTGIDRSAVAIEAAARRNPGADLRVLALEDAEFAAASFDRVLAVNVNHFWVRPAAPELDAIRSWLAPGGRLCLVYEPPTAGRARTLAADVLGAVTAHGFHATVARSGTLVCVTGTPA